MQPRNDTSDEFTPSRYIFRRDDRLGEIENKPPQAPWGRVGSHEAHGFYVLALVIIGAHMAPWLYMDYLYNLHW